MTAALFVVAGLAALGAVLAGLEARGARREAERALDLADRLDVRLRVTEANLVVNVKPGAKNWAEVEPSTRKVTFGSGNYLTMTWRGPDGTVRWAPREQDETDGEGDDR